MAGSNCGMRDGKSFGGTQFNVAGLKLCSAVSFSDAGHVLISFQLLIASLSPLVF
jgi:hypothetical protein